MSEQQNKSQFITSKKEVEEVLSIALDHLKQVEAHLDNLEEQEIIAKGVTDSSLAVKFLEQKYAYKPVFKHAAEMERYRYLAYHDESKTIEIPIVHIDEKEFPDLDFKPQQEDVTGHPPYKLSYLNWLLQVMQTQVPLGKSIVTGNERIGDYVVLPRKISQEHKTLIRTYEIHANQCGFSVDNEYVFYSGKFDYKMVYKSAHFMLCKVQPEPKQYFTTTVKQLFKHALNKITFGYYELDPEYVQLASGFKIRYRTTADLLWKIVFIPYEEMNHYFNIVAPAYQHESMNIRIRNAMSDFGHKNKLNPDLLDFTSAFAVGLAFNWEHHQCKQKEEKIVTEFDTIYGVCSGNQAEGVKLKQGAKFIDDITNIIGVECVDRRQVAWAYERCLSSKNISEHSTMQFPLGCGHDGRNACICRQLREVNEPLKEEMIQLNDFTHYILPEIMPILKTRVMSNQKWTEHLRSDQYRQYAEGKFEEYGRQYVLNQTDTKSTCFVKMEPHFKKVVKPRFITSRMSSLNLKLGKWTYTASKIMGKIFNYKDHKYDDFNHESQAYQNNYVFYDKTKEKYFSKLVYAGGHNRDSLGDFINDVMKKFIKPIFLSTDFSKFDSHISPALKCILECSLFSHLFPNMKEPQELLKTQLRTRGYMRSRRYGYSQKYEVEGTRGSGDQNTTIGNSFIAMLLQLYCINKQYNVLHLLEKDKLRIINLGDDCLLCFDGWCPNIDRYQEDMYNCGMEVKAEISDIANVKFLSGMFVPATRVIKEKDGSFTKTNTYLHTPLIGRMIQKAFVSIHKYENKEQQKAWVKSNALAYLKMYSHITPMWVWFNRIYKKYSMVKKRAPKERERHLQVQYNYDEHIEKLKSKEDFPTKMVILNNNVIAGPVSTRTIFDDPIINHTQNMLMDRYQLTKEEFEQWSKLLSVDDVDWTHEIWLKLIKKDCPDEEDENLPAIQEELIKYQDEHNSIKDDEYFASTCVPLSNDDGYVVFDHHKINEIQIETAELDKQIELEHISQKPKFDLEEVQKCIDHDIPSYKQHSIYKDESCQTIKAKDDEYDKNKYLNGIVQLNKKINGEKRNKGRNKKTYKKKELSTKIKEEIKQVGNTWFDDKRMLLKGSVSNIDEEVIARNMYYDKNYNFENGPWDVKEWRNQLTKITESTRGFKPCKNWTNCPYQEQCKFYHNDNQKSKITPYEFNNYMIKFNLIKRIVNYLIHGEYMDFAPNQNLKKSQLRINDNFKKAKSKYNNKSENLNVDIKSPSVHKNDSGVCTLYINSDCNGLLLSNEIIKTTIKEDSPCVPKSPTKSVSKKSMSISPQYKNPTSPSVVKSEMQVDYEARQIEYDKYIEDIDNGLVTPPPSLKEYLQETKKNQAEINDELQKLSLVVDDDAEKLCEEKYDMHIYHQSQDNRINKDDLTPEERHEMFMDKNKLTKKMRVIYNRFIKHMDEDKICDNVFYLAGDFNQDEGLYWNDSTLQKYFELYVGEYLTDEKFQDIFDFVKSRDETNFNNVMTNEIVQSYEVGSPPLEEYEDPKQIYEENLNDDYYNYEDNF